MAKASLLLPSGTKIQIEGTPEEVHKIIELHSQTHSQYTSPPSNKASTKKSQSPPPDKRLPVSLEQIIATIKSCEEAELIEQKVLDNPSQLSRILVCLYVAHEHFETNPGLTSADISTITKDLGVPISRTNTATTLSGAAAKYVTGDRVRKPGIPVRYTINRRGLQYMKSILVPTER